MAKYHLPTVQAYATALERLRLPPSYRRMLEAHVRAEDRTLKTRQLGKAAKYKSWRAVNLHYGRLGPLLRDELRLRGPGQASHVFASFSHSGREGDEWRWTLHEEFAKAVRSVLVA